MKVFLEIADEYGAKISLRPFAIEPAQGRVVLLFSKHDEAMGTFELEQYHIRMLIESLTSIIEGTATLREIKEKKFWEKLDFSPVYKAMAQTKSTQTFHLFLSDKTGEHFLDQGSTEKSIRRDFEECPGARMPQDIFKEVAGDRLGMYKRID